MSDSPSPEPWRYRCPEGHAGWHSRNSWKGTAKAPYYCATCQENGDDPHFEELRDMKA